MPKLIGHFPHIKNRPARLLPTNEVKRLVKLSYSQKCLIPQDQIFYIFDTSDRGSKGTLAKRWYRWYALPESIAHAKYATKNMFTKAFPKCHITWKS